MRSGTNQTLSLGLCARFEDFLPMKRPHMREVQLLEVRLEIDFGLEQREPSFELDDELVVRRSVARDDVLRVGSRHA